MRNRWKLRTKRCAKYFAPADAHPLLVLPSHSPGDLGDDAEVVEANAWTLRPLAYAYRPGVTWPPAIDAGNMRVVDGT